MALNKYQRLKRAITQTLERYNRFYEEVAKTLDALHIRFYKVNEHQESSLLMEGAPLLEEAKGEAILYCASEEELSEWIDWQDRENKAWTFTNQLLSVANYCEKVSILETNLLKPALPFFEETSRNFFGEIQYNKIRKTLDKAKFVPTQDTSLAQAYDLVNISLYKQEERYHDELKRTWRTRLEKLIVEGVDWPEEEKKGYFKEWKSNLRILSLEAHQITSSEKQPQDSLSQNTPDDKLTDSRWKTSRALDRQTYASFILYFAKKFCEQPTDEHMGEIALLLWAMVHIAQDSAHTWTIDRLIKLTTANLKDRILFTEDGKEVELSCGLAHIFHAYTGGKCLQKEQKSEEADAAKTRKIRLFPHLTQDKLADALHRASKEILPSGSLPALLEAFLTFPHLLKKVRMPSKLRKQQQANPGKVYHDPFPWEGLKHQLFSKGKKP